MYSQKFRCTTQEPLILFKKAKTEQSTETLEYLPGSLFRGFMANQLFNNKESETIIDDIIFNGSVRFGDAHLCINDKRGNPIPLSYHKYKSKIIIDGNIQPEYINLIKMDELPTQKHKQLREGYFVFENDKIVFEKVAVGERMKAARSLENRASKDGAMFLYRYIKADHTFEFEIKAINKAQLDTIVKCFDGKTIYLGKSKNAEFGGKVIVKKIGESEDVDLSSEKVKVNTLYASSNWCFLNGFGTYTSQITSEMLCGVPNIEIDWTKTFLRFRTYSPFNSHRQTFDAQRLIIEKGSVVTFIIDEDNDVEIDTNFIKKGIGCHLTEGFGEVLINPDFLEKADFDFCKPIQLVIIKEEIINDFFNILKSRADLKDQTKTNFDTAQEIFTSHSNKFPNNLNTQWGRIFALINDLNTKEKISAKLVIGSEAALTKSKHSKWKTAEIDKLKGIINGNSPEAFKIFVKKMIKDKRNV